MVTATPARKIVLPGGLTILHQKNPVSRAFCFGVWTRTGARDERVGEDGLCHFLEHMLFKGTPTRTAFEISQQIERVGGSLDAFTTKDTMCLYAQVLESQRDLAMDLLSDMILCSTFPEEQVALEREVVLEEIGDVHDAPDDLIHEVFASSVFKGHPLGRPILGTKATVSSFTRRDLRRYAARTFRGGNVVIAVYGNIDARELRRVCRHAFSFAPGDTAVVRPRLPRPIVARKTMRRKLHQQHVCIGTRTFSWMEERRYALMVLTTMLGGGMSSRLFQRIREEMGLTYNIYTYSDHASDTGLMATYLAVRPSNAALAVREVMREFKRLASGDVSAMEIEDTKEQLKGRILLGLESSTARMMRLARNELNYGRQVPERELIGAIAAVTRDDVVAIAENVLASDRQTMVTLGPGTAGIRL